MAVLASAYRLWAAVRVGVVLASAAESPLSDDARPGIGAKRAAYKRRMALEVAALTGRPSLGIYFDLATLYDTLSVQAVTPACINEVPPP